jgi:hypothetical protein
MNETIYHETKTAKYVKGCNGLLSVTYKGNYSSDCICKVSNDEDGHHYINTVLKPLFGNKIRLIYRCPKSGRSYPRPNRNLNTNGQLRKEDALVVDVRKSTQGYLNNR